MRSVLEELRQQFDMIVFDTPPLALVTDAAVLGTLADSTILVARAGATDGMAARPQVGQCAKLPPCQRLIRRAASAKVPNE